MATDKYPENDQQGHDKTANLEEGGGAWGKALPSSFVQIGNHPILAMSETWPLLHQGLGGRARQTLSYLHFYSGANTGATEERARGLTGQKVSVRRQDSPFEVYRDLALAGCPDRYANEYPFHFERDF